MFISLLQKKRIFSFLIMSSASILLFGCVTTQHGNGIVIKKEMYNVAKKRNLSTIKERTLKTAAPAALGGAAAFGAFGGVATLLSPSHDVVPLLSFTAIGAFIGGTVGLISGGGIGLLEYGFMSSHATTWQYKVKSLNTDKVFTIREQSTSIPLNTEVKVIERNGEMFIRSI